MAGDGAVLLVLRLVGGAALEQGNLQVVDARAELLIVDGLEEVVGDLQAQRLAAIGEVVVAGDDDKGGVRMLDAAELDHLEAVHNGDVDIHNDDIRLKGVDLGQGLHTVGGLAHHLTVVGGPVKQALEALADHDLVVYQQYAQRFHISSLRMGSSRWAVTPPSSFSV